jgi:diphthamide biosynthesis methyltransferase
MALRQAMRDRILTISRADLASAAQRYLFDDYDASAVGILAGDALLETARAELEKLGARFERL